MTGIAYGLDEISAGTARESASVLVEGEGLREAVGKGTAAI